MVYNHLWYKNKQKQKQKAKLSHKITKLIFYPNFMDTILKLTINMVFPKFPTSHFLWRVKIEDRDSGVNE